MKQQRQQPNWERRLRAQLRANLGDSRTEGQRPKVAPDHVQEEQNLARMFREKLGPVRESAPTGGRIVRIQETLRCGPGLPVE